MMKSATIIALVLALASCSNTPELETGEIKTLQLFKNSFDQSDQAKVFIDSRKLLSRSKIDSIGVPILFVELKTGQNGTLTLYPGQGVGQTWLGADGATVTLDRGILKATRGMGDDLMGSFSSIPTWSKINNKGKTYIRESHYLTGKNKIQTHILNCKIKRNDDKQTLKIWEATFTVTKFDETCTEDGFVIKNTYYLDNLEVIRKSLQYHGETIGYIVTERLDR